MADSRSTVLTAAELDLLLRTHFPEIDVAVFRIESVQPMAIRLRLRAGPQHLRPGGTISGPTLMMLADVAVYLAILAMIGPAVQAVTTNLNIHFLRRPAPADVVADARLLRLGRRIAVGEVTIHSVGEAEPVAVATVSYALPADAAAR